MNIEDHLYTYKAIVTNVVDGDTVDLTIDHGIHIKRAYRMRLLDLDTPELRGEERPRGLLAKDALISRILSKVVIVKTQLDESDKYGRLLGTIFLGDENINAWMIQNGHSK